MSGSIVNLKEDSEELREIIKDLELRYFRNGETLQLSNPYTQLANLFNNKEGKHEF